MADVHILPDGWRPMWELPAPGLKRKFLFISDNHFEYISFSPMYSLGTEVLTPVGWRYA